MNNNDGFDWLDEIRRRQYEPAASWKTLLAEGTLWAATIAGLGYTLGNFA